MGLEPCYIKNTISITTTFIRRYGAEVSLTTIFKTLHLRKVKVSQPPERDGDGDDNEIKIEQQVVAASRQDGFRPAKQNFLLRERLGSPHENPPPMNDSKLPKTFLQFNLENGKTSSIPTRPSIMRPQ